MPSPFPGMDPYLEGEMWQEFHETLAGAIRPMPEPVPILSIEIRDVAQRRLVTAIEILSTVPVPLLPPDSDVPLDLQAALAACFDLVGYEQLLDYTQPPPPPKLSAEDVDWVERVLSQARGQVEAGEGIFSSDAHRL